MAESPCIKRRRKHLTPEEKIMICNVYEGLRKRDPNSSKSDTITLCSLLTKVNETSIYKCIRTTDKPEAASTKKEENRGRKKIIIDDDTRYAIRRIAHSFFFRNEIPNVKKIAAAIESDNSMPKISRHVLLRTLREMKCRYLKRNRKSLLIEKPEVVLWRRDISKKSANFVEKGRKFIGWTKRG